MCRCVCPLANLAVDQNDVPISRGGVGEGREIRQKGKEENVVRVFEFKFRLSPS